jgi:hypothetical protein
MADPKHTVKSILITQAIAIFGFVVVPAAVTFIAPRTTVELRRDEDHVSARITRHILLVIPFRTLTIEPVVEVESQVTAGKYGYSTNSDRRRGRKVNQAGDGSVWIIGRDSKCQVQSTPADAPVQAEQIRSFLENPAAEPVVITATAGWALTYLLGSAMTGLSALYCLGATLAVGRWLLGLAMPGRGSNASE